MDENTKIVLLAVISALGVGLALFFAWLNNRRKNNKK